MGTCKFSDCTHTNEPGCRILEAIKNGADTYEKVKKETGANTYGCFACRLEIKKLLEENK